MEASSRLEIQDKQSRLFVYAQNQGVDILEFVDCFMKSDLVKEIDKDFSNVQLETISSWYEEIFNKYKIKKSKSNVSEEILLWLGYFYRKWHYLTGEPSFKIIRYLPANEAIKSYMAFHQIEENDAISEAKSRFNQSRSTHRKYESKLYKIDKSFYENNFKYFSFLAKKILYRLTNDERIKKMIYQNNKFIYKNYISLNTRIITRDDKSKVFNIYNTEKNININECNNNVLFYFIFSKEYELLSPDNYELKKEIKKISESKRYGEIYFYILGKIYYINLSGEIKKYNLPISYRTRLSVKREMELDDAYNLIRGKLDC